MTKEKKPPPKVLVIDVERSRVEEIERIVRNGGFRAARCLSPRSALRRIKRERPDVVVVEVVMPGMSGFEIAARMQADECLARIPVLFTTDIQNAGKGNHDYFPRPLNESAFLKALRSRISDEQ